jgi:DNA replication and repair protein RecF
VYLRSLQLTNYRSFRRLSLNLADGPTIIQGENAQGKTNLLEAVELLATGKSARAGSDRELIHWAVAANAADSGPAFARINAVVAHPRGETHADVLLRLSDPADDGTQPIASKTFRVNGIPRRALEFVGEINVVAFSPEDVDLVAGSPSGRRRYLDITNGQMSGRYLRSLQRFNKVLVQRNQLLRQSRELGRTDPSLQAWDEELTTHGGFILQERARSVRALAGHAERWFLELGGSGKLEIRYQPGVAEPEASVLRGIPEQGDAALDAIQTAFRQAFGRVRERERAAATTLVGPHRDDLTFLVDGIDMNVYGSRGQQRLAALSLKLAEMDLLAAHAGSRPILLLDDVLSELDRPKQSAVLQAVVTGGQTLLTVTSLDAIGRTVIAEAPVFRLMSGGLTANGVAS